LWFPGNHLLQIITSNSDNHLLQICVNLVTPHI
jgi:hypothetical protein